MLHLWEIKEEYDIYPLLSIHDSIVVEVPNKETVPILKKIIEDRAYEIVKGAIPFLVDADWGYDWSMRKQ